MTVTIEPIRTEHIDGYHNVEDLVSGE